MTCVWITDSHTPSNWIEDWQVYCERADVNIQIHSDPSLVDTSSNSVNRIGMFAPTFLQYLRGDLKYPSFLSASIPIMVVWAHISPISQLFYLQCLVKAIPGIQLLHLIQSQYHAKLVNRFGLGKAVYYPFQLITFPSTKGAIDLSGQILFFCDLISWENIGNLSFWTQKMGKIAKRCKEKIDNELDLSCETHDLLNAISEPIDPFSLEYHMIYVRISQYIQQKKIEAQINKTNQQFVITGKVSHSVFSKISSVKPEFLSLDTIRSADMFVLSSPYGDAVPLEYHCLSTLKNSVFLSQPNLEKALDLKSIR